MATITYTGGGNPANWADPLDWKGGVAPGVSDTALLVGGSGFSSTVTSAVAVNNLMILEPASITFDGAVTTYGLGACKGFMVCVGGTATFAPGSSLADGGVLQAGLHSIGTIVAVGTASEATTLQAERTELGKFADGNGILTIDGASLTNTDGLTVGEAGRGTLTVEGGGQVTAAHMTVGLDAGASGQVFLAGASTLTTTGFASIGGMPDNAAGGTGAITIGSGATLHAEGGLRVTAGSSATLAGGTIDYGDSKGWMSVAGTLGGSGTITTRAGGGLTDDGTIAASGGTLDVNAAVFGRGSLTIAADATLQLGGRTADLPKMQFLGSGGTLDLGQGMTVTAEIDGFAAGDTIAMAGVTGANWNSTTDLLTLTGGGHTIDRLHLGGSFSTSQFVVTQQGGMGLISLHG